MRMEVITKRDDLVIRRLVLEPGEATPWHTDSCHRFSVVVRGEQLLIEFRDTGEQVRVAVHPGMADWDDPGARVHRGVRKSSRFSLILRASILNRSIPGDAQVGDLPWGVRSLFGMNRL